VPKLDKLDAGDAILWRRGEKHATLVHTEAPTTELKRHSRKYAEGALAEEDCFYFRGPEGKLSLKAQNLIIFLQMADGVDDETWEYHRGRNDYSRWLRDKVKDGELADEVESVENDESLSPEASRAGVRAAIEGRYTLPADKPSGAVDETAAAS
jgi:hypothetical protein